MVSIAVAAADAPVMRMTMAMTMTMTMTMTMRMGMRMMRMMMMMVVMTMADADADADDDDADDDDDAAGGGGGGGGGDSYVALVFLLACIFVGFILPVFFCASNELLGSPGGRKARRAFIFRKPSTSGHLRIKSAHFTENCKLYWCSTFSGLHPDFLGHRQNEQTSSKEFQRHEKLRQRS